MKTETQKPSAPAQGTLAGVEKIHGVTHRGTDGETKAYLEAGRLWISDGVGGWLRCNPGVESYFSPNVPDHRHQEIPR